MHGAHVLALTHDPLPSVKSYVECQSHETLILPSNF